MKPWRTTDRKTLYEQPPWLRLEAHRVQLPGGDEIPEWLWIQTPDFANVVVRDSEGMFLLFRQTKYAVSGPTLALPGGYVEPGEEPLHAAQRELREELGAESEDWTSLGSYAVDGNRGCGTAHLFFANHARVIQEPDADDLEEHELLRLTEQELRQALHDHAFGVLPWATGVAMVLTLVSE